MMRYSFWYGGCKADDLEWLEEAATLLKNNEWKAGTPLYFDGTGWGEQDVRENAAITLLQALQDNTSTKSLFLRNASLGAKAQQALSDVFENNSHLESISVRNLRNSTEAMTLPISLFQNTSLKELSLERVRLSTQGCQELSKVLRSSEILTSLTLEKVHMDGGLEALTDALSQAKSLRKLTINGTTFSQQELQALFQALGSNKSLTKVQLEGLSLNLEQATGLALMLEQNQHLQQLSLRNNDLNGSAMETILLQGLCNNTTLRELLLSRNPVGDDGAAAVVSALQQNSTLRRLCLVNCEIWTEGCLKIASGVAQMKGVRELDMDCNEIEFCARQVLQSIKEGGNCTITSFTRRLSLLIRNAEEDGDQETATLWKQIEVYLQWNQAGRRVFAQANADRLLPIVLSRSSEQPDLVFQFLRTTPW